MPVLLVIALIAIVVILKRKTKKKATAVQIVKEPIKKDYRLRDFNEHFELVLNNTLDFIDSFLECCPQEWIFINISTLCEKGEFSTDRRYYYNEFVEFKVYVGSWYDGILWKSKDAEDYMKTVYTFDPSENVFVYRIRIGESTNCMIPQEKVSEKLFECIDAYEKNNPGRRLDRTSYGINHKWNLS